MGESESTVRSQVRELEAREQRARELGPRLRAVAPADPSETPGNAPPALAPRASLQAPAGSHLPEGVQRALNGLRVAVPVFKKLLPLLDGRVVATISNLLEPHTLARPADLSPLENGMADLRLRHIELANKVGEQNTVLKRFSDVLENVQEAAARNAQELEELKETLAATGRRANTIALAALCILVLSLAANVFLFYHFQALLH
jgi:hypothetical protein